MNRLLLVLSLLLTRFFLFPSIAHAADPVFGGWFSAFLSSINNRTRIIQVCVVTMCLALFILMKKFSDVDSRS